MNTLTGLAATTGTGLNRFFISECLLRACKPTWLHGPRWRVSIASSSANVFLVEMPLLTEPPNVGVSIASSSANVFLVEDEKLVGCSQKLPQSLLHQRMSS